VALSRAPFVPIAVPAPTARVTVAPVATTGVVTLGAALSGPPPAPRSPGTKVALSRAPFVPIAVPAPTARVTVAPVATTGVVTLGAALSGPPPAPTLAAAPGKAQRSYHGARFSSSAGPTLLTSATREKSARKHTHGLDFSISGYCAPQHLWRPQRPQVPRGDVGPDPAEEPSLHGTFATAEWAFVEDLTVAREESFANSANASSCQCQ